MPIIDPVTVINTIKPANGLATFGVAEDTDLIGGFRVVASIVERDAVAADKCKVGQFVFVTGDAKLYRMISVMPVTYVEWVSGGGGSATQIANSNDVTVIEDRLIQRLPVNSTPNGSVSAHATAILTRALAAGTLYKFEYDLLVSTTDALRGVRLGVLHSGLVEGFRAQMDFASADNLPGYAAHNPIGDGEPTSERRTTTTIGIGSLDYLSCYGMLVENTPTPMRISGSFFATTAGDLSLLFRPYVINGTGADIVVHANSILTLEGFSYAP